MMNNIYFSILYCNFFRNFGRQTLQFVENPREFFERVSFAR